MSKFEITVYNTVVVKDIVARSGNKDVVLLEKILRYVISNTGNIISSNKISGFLSSQGKGDNIKSSTVATYLDTLQKAYIVYKVNRFDIKGKEQLNVCLIAYLFCDTICDTTI